MKQKQKVREAFRNAVFKRDNYQCKFCNVVSDLDAHHITDRNLMPNGGYVKENGISLCTRHHIDAEQFHINNGKTWVEGFHPNDLYRKINSTFELAVKKSKEL